MTTQTKTFEASQMASGGMGAFLNPPTHPDHTHHLETDLKRRKWNRGSMSLSYALECDYISDGMKRRITKMYENWHNEKPAIDTPEIKDWICNVLGYFRHCYSPDGINRNSDSCLIWIAKNEKYTYGEKWQHFKRDNNNHLGVMHIREFYPDYKPAASDFRNAYWGKKQN